MWKQTPFTASDATMVMPNNELLVDCFLFLLIIEMVGYLLCHKRGQLSNSALFQKLALLLCWFVRRVEVCYGGPCTVGLSNWSQFYLGGLDSMVLARRFAGGTCRAVCIAAVSKHCSILIIDPEWKLCFSRFRIVLFDEWGMHCIFITKSLIGVR